MLLYVGKNFTASVSGSIVKEVTCEKCRGRFYYQLARAASDSASAPYYIGQAWAQARAQKGAARKLAKILHRDSELVPCPHCGHLQEQMIRQLRRRMYGGLRVAGWLISGVGLLVIGVIALGKWSAHPRRFDENHDDYLTAAAICIAVWFAFMLLRHLLVMRVGKKGNEHLLHGALLGAPPPLLPEQHPDADGQIPLRPAPLQQATAARNDDQWVVFPLLRIALPQVCCECLSPCNTVYRSLLSSSENDGMKVPLCPVCVRRVRGRAWRGFALTALMCLSAGALLAMLPDKMDLFGRGTIAVLIAVVASLLAAVLVPSVLSPPFAYKTIDKQRAIVRLCFRNRQYTRLLRQVVNTLEGGAQAPGTAQRA